ncbi:helix-turn-helix transcriptional regulator [Rickettsiella endosymbiont of Miltochrista miniata]|uniref:response regulator transcription factor n=1 Tax=Rickettsiella endosymbiont of Miltochrista miniata TaxID=3066239 RepID=UPI00313CC632
MNNIKTVSVLNKLHEQEKHFKRDLAQTFLEYLDSLPTNKRIEQMEAILYERNLPTLDRRLTPQEKKCLFLASQGKEIKEMASLLCLSQRTIKYHRANIIKKLEVANITAAATYSSLQYKINDCIDTIYSSLSGIQTNQIFAENIIPRIPGNVYWLDEQGFGPECNDNVLNMFGFKSVDEFKGYSLQKWEKFVTGAKRRFILLREIVWRFYIQGKQNLILKSPL